MSPHSNMIRQKPLQILIKSRLKAVLLFLILLATVPFPLMAETALADTTFVLVADTNNPADVTGIGSVREPFAIAKYDVTASEYQEFLEAVEPSDAHGLYYPEMSSDPAVACITNTIAADGIHYGVIAGREKFPITYVSWPDAIRYCNWLQHGRPTRENVTPETTETSSYTIGSDDAGNTTYALQTNALYFLPSRDQWHKAAYYRHDIKTYWTYPTSCNMAPGNSLTAGCANEANYRTGDL